MGTQTDRIGRLDSLLGLDQPDTSVAPEPPDRIRKLDAALGLGEPEPEQPGLFKRALDFAGRMGAPGIPQFQAESLEPEAIKPAAEVAPQAARGVGEAGLAAGIGLGEVAGAAERVVRGVPDMFRGLGAAARRIVQPGMAGLRGAPTPTPEPEPTAGERVAGGLRGAREGLRETIGDPGTGLGTAAQIGGRLAGEAAMFAAPGMAAGRLAGPARTLAGQVGRNIALGAPVDVAIASAGPEESVAGGLGELLDSETLRGVAEDPVQRAAFDVAAGALPSAVVDAARPAARRLRGPRAAPAPAPPTTPPIRPPTEPPTIREAPPAPVEAPRPPEPEVTPRDPDIAPPEPIVREPEPAGQPGFARIGDVRGFFRRHFTSAGDLPEQVFKRKIERDGWVNSQLRQVRYTLRDFDKAVRQSYGRKPSPEQLQQVDDALKGQLPREELPEQVRPVVDRMRSEIDALSRHGIDEGLFEGELAAKVDDNLGVYATRSYRAFDDPQWAEKVAPEVRNRAKGLFRSELPDAPEEEIEGLIDELLYRKDDGPIAFLASGKLGSKPRSLFMRRKDIHPDIRALLGEYRDPRVNYARSVTKMAQGIANHRLLKQVKAEGMGRFLFEKPIAREGESFRKQIAAEGSKVMEPLDGLYTTPEIERAFRESLDPQQSGDWLRMYMKANSAAKYGKTILSPMTHVRNTVGNTGFAVANGHWRAAKMGNAWRATLADMGASNSEKWRNRFRKLQELGVVHESVRAGELGDAIRDASKTNVGIYADNYAERGVRKGLRGAQELYQAEDNVWKVFAFENELARYRKALPDLPVEEVERRAAEIVRNTYPTYSLVPGAVRTVRRFPFMGTFVSFPAEVGRTAYNTINLVSRELADPKLRGIGVQRLAGLLAAVSAVPAITTASRQLAGVTLGEDRDMRRFLPSWSKNSSLAYLNKDPESGKVSYTDLSYTDPYSYLRKPLIAFLNGEDWQQATLEAVGEASAPFFSEEMLASKLADVARNTKKESGGQVWNPQAPFLEKLQGAIGHIWDAFEPGAISQGRRIRMGLTGEQTPYGRSYDPAQEIGAVVSGVRLSEMDVPQSLSFRARDFSRELQDANRQLSSVAARRGTVSDDELVTAYRQAERSRRDLFERMYRDAQAAIRLGMQEDQVYRVLDSAGLSRRDAGSILAGYYEPREIGGGFLRGVIQSVQALSDDPDEAYETFGRRRSILERMAGESEPTELSDRPAPTPRLERLQQLLGTSPQPERQ